MKKIIFLDIDGVLATPKSVEGVGGMWQIEDEKQDILEELLKDTGADIVLSSSWRRHTLEDTKIHMTQEGFRFSDKIIGVTIRAYHFIQKGFPMSMPRGVEIQHWIDNYIHRQNNQGSFERKKLGVDYTYVILDDDSDMLYTQAPYFIQTNPEEGLTQFDKMWATMILNGRHKAVETKEFKTYNYKKE